MSPVVSGRIPPLGIRFGVACLAAALISPSFLSAQDFYVNGRTGADTASNGTSPTTPWKTIGYALASIPRPGPGTNPQLWVEGDQVYSPATNGETFPIRAAYQVWVEGTLPRGNRPVLAPPAGTTAIAFDPAEFYQRNDVTWRYLRFSGGEYGMTIGANPSQKHAPRVQDCEFVDQTKAGVRIDGLSTGTNDPRFFQNSFEGAPSGIEMHVPGTNSVVYPDIEENTFTRITGDAILLDDSSPSGGNVGARIASCWFRNAAAGVRLRMTSRGRVPSLDVSTCSFSGLIGTGIKIEVSSGSGASAKVQKSSFVQCHQGVVLEGTLSSGTCSLELTGNAIRTCTEGALVNLAGTGTLEYRSRGNTVEQCATGFFLQGVMPGITVQGSVHTDRYLLNQVGLAILPVQATGRFSVTSTLLAKNTAAASLSRDLPTTLRSLSIAGGQLGLVCDQQTAHLTIDHVVFAGVPNPVSGTPAIHHSCFSNLSWPGTGNLNNTDPQLVLPFYKLAPTSPCIDAGDPQTPLPDTDYEGDPRASVSKLGGQALPDIGADEYVFRGSARKYGTPGFGYFNFFPEISAGSPNASLGSTLDVRLSGAWLPVYHIPATSALLTLGTRDDAGNLPFDLGPFGAPGSLLWNDVTLVLGPYAVANDGTASAPLPIPNLASLRGLNLAFQWFATLPQANAAGFATSDGLRVSIGESATQLVEEFDNDAFLDADNSSARWGSGVLRGRQIGGTGVDGEFSLDTPGIEDLGNGTWLFRTTPEVVGGQSKFVEIPAERSYKNAPRQVADGRLEFSKFVVPAGQTLVFRGTLPPRISVRGKGEILGTLSLDGTSSTSTWNGSSATGRPGFAGGCFGGAGGNGGDKGNGLGHQSAFDGKPGEDVRLPAGHAYATRAIGTGGRGSVQYPLDGLVSSITTQGISGSVSDQLSAAGGGGGYDAAGEIGKAYYTLGNKLTNLGPDAAGGLRFDNFPLPPSTATADHFLVGGSGGGGAGSCPFFASSPNKVFKSGGSGTGGGGAIALRTGYALAIGPSAAISARGGSGYQSLNNFNSVPEGGGGSGGSIVLQTSGTVAQNGTLSVRGGLGAQALVTQTRFELKVKGGDGAPGLIRLETPAPAVAQLGTCEPPATTRDVGTLTESDTKVGAQSRWYRTDSPTPLFVRYRIDALVDAAPASFSDDPALGLPLAKDGEAVEFYVQGANLDAQGNPIPGQVSEWLRYVGRFPGNQGRSLQEAGYSSFRWQMVLNRTNGRDVAIERVTVVWQG